MKINGHSRIVFAIVAICVIAFCVRGQEPCPVDVPCNGILRFAEYGNVPAGDERAVLDRLAKQLQTSSDEIVYVQVYAGEVACVDEARQRTLRIKNYLIRKFAIAADRIILKDGGFKVDLSTELWLLPRTTHLPEASPQLKRANKVLGRCKLPALNDATPKSLKRIRR